MRNRIALFAIAIGLALAASVCADDNVRAVQTKLRDGGFYLGEIDGAYSNQLSAALSRYQIRNGLPITGHLDVDTAKALGAKPAVAASTTDDSAPTSETWERLRKSDKEFLARMERSAKSSPSSNVSGNEPAAATTPATSSESAKPASAPPAAASDGISSSPDFSTERLRDYVGAFVLAGLDAKVGAEAAFFSDRVQYYDSGTMDRDRIREDLKRYDERWPKRRFWLAGDIAVEPQSGSRVRVRFPLKYDLRNGAKHSSGKVNKTLVLERAGDDLQIVAVNERKID
jgi:hypothetical protein